MKGVQGRESPDSDAEDEAYDGVAAGVKGKGIPAARVAGVIGGGIAELRPVVDGVWAPPRLTEVGVANMPPVELLGVVKAWRVVLVGVEKPPSLRANLGVLIEPRVGVENMPLEGVWSVRSLLGVDVAGIEEIAGRSASGMLGIGVGDKDRRRLVLPLALGVTWDASWSYGKIS